MPQMTLRQWLGKPDPGHTVVPTALPSVQESAVDVDDWEVWESFDEKIEKLFRNILDHTYDFPSVPGPVHSVHLQLVAESSLDCTISTWNLQLVNTALRVISKKLREASRLVWGPDAAARPVSNLRPDWSAVLSNSAGAARQIFIAGESKMFKGEFPQASDLGMAPSLKENARGCLHWSRSVQLSTTRGGSNIDKQPEPTWTGAAAPDARLSNAYAPPGGLPTPAFAPPSSPCTAAVIHVNPQVRTVNWCHAPGASNGLNANVALFALHWFAVVENGLGSAYQPLLAGDGAYVKSIAKSEEALNGGSG
ncbi:uncharacterized protein LTHEOB_11345 [Neofusicoccum parvum]|nr:uncharacterized protein LTHEOB_11345 [Neofusicoccum parvum]